MTLKHTLRLVFALVGALMLTAAVMAQPGNYKPGDKIDYLEYGKWETGGTYVGTTPGGSQPIIRKKPTQFDPEGAQIALSWDGIRPSAGPRCNDAKPGQMKAGDKIDYQEYGKWETGGTFVGSTPGGSQPIIRKKPTQFDPEGAQVASQWNDIRPAAGQGCKDQKPDAQPEDPPQRDDPNPVGGNNDPINGDCNAPLSETQITAFLEKNVGPNPFQNPARKDAADAKLTSMIAKCGVNFRYDSDLLPIGISMRKYGMVESIHWLPGNFDTPPEQDWYYGTWSIGNQVFNDFKDWTRLHVADFSNRMTLTITDDHKYVWKVPKGPTITGTWRAATAAEMAQRHQGGAGIVLEKAYGGWDRLVRQDDTSLINQGRTVDISAMGPGGGANLYGYR